MSTCTTEQLKQRVRDLRSLYSVTQEEFAEIYGISPRTVQSWEALGNNRAPKESFMDLMEFYYIREGYKRVKGE